MLLVKPDNVFISMNFLCQVHHDTMVWHVSEADDPEVVTGQASVWRRFWNHQTCEQRRLRVRTGTG